MKTTLENGKKREKTGRSQPQQREKRSLFFFSPGEHQRLTKWMKDSFAKSRRRNKLRQRAKEIRAKYRDVFAMADVPAEKWFKLIKACGEWPVGRSNNLKFNESVDDMDQDSFFGNASREKRERQKLVEECDAGKDVGDEKENEHTAQEDKIEMIDPSTLTASPAPECLGGGGSLLRSSPVGEFCIQGNSPVKTSSPVFSASSPTPAKYLIDYRAKAVPAALLILPETVQTYLDFLANHPDISRFMRYDYCRVLADKYLLAVVCVYFIRAGLSDFTADAFFKFLYLANEAHEDDDDTRYNICAWVLGENWRDGAPQFLAERLYYWGLLKYEMIVLRKTVEQLFTVDPENPIWLRERKAYHGGATRWYIQEYKDLSPKGSFRTPDYCQTCARGLRTSELPTKLQKYKHVPLKKRPLQYGQTPALSEK